MIQYIQYCMFCQTREGYCYSVLGNSGLSNLSADIKYASL